jgi:glycosyltransferase involved in cell wall biosynthesis
MKVKIQQFLFGKSHSWSVVGKNIGKSLMSAGHNVDFISTDGFAEKFADGLQNATKFNQPYDLQFSYTAPINFKNYLNKSFGGISVGMWAYEFPIWPQGFSKLTNDVDYFASPSEWFKQISIKNNIKDDKIIVMPHGVDWEKFKNAKPLNIKTNKSVKFFVNFAQPHLRKNIPGTLKAWGKAFTKDDDVCLVMKVVDKKPQQLFEINFREKFNSFKKEFPNHADIILITDYVEDMSELYAAIDILFMIPNAEAFFLPALEALAAGKNVITSRYGGQLDFLNDDNSFLVDCKLGRAPRESQYWNSSVYSEWGIPETDCAVDMLRYCYNNFSSINKTKPDDKFKEKYSWNNNVKILEGLK